METSKQQQTTTDVCLCLCMGQVVGDLHGQCCDLLSVLEHTRGGAEMVWGQTETTEVSHLSFPNYGRIMSTQFLCQDSSFSHSSSHMVINFSFLCAASHALILPLPPLSLRLILSCPCYRCATGKEPTVSVRVPQGREGGGASQAHEPRDLQTQPPPVERERERISGPPATSPPSLTLLPRRRRWS